MRKPLLLAATIGATLAIAPAARADHVPTTDLWPTLQAKVEASGDWEQRGYGCVPHTAWVGGFSHSLVGGGVRVYVDQNTGEIVSQRFKASGTVFRQWAL